MIPRILKIKHHITFNYSVNKWITPLTKALICYKYSDFNKLSPAFNPKRTIRNHMIDSNSFSTNEKILICGWPKAGNMWFEALLSEYFNLPHIQPFLDIRSSGIAHNHFPLGIDILYRQDILLCFYIVRDLRDIICSFYRYASTPFHLNHVNANYNTQFSIEEFYYKYFLKVIVHRYDFFNNAQKYLEKGVSLVHYESLVKNQENELKRIFNENNIRIDENKIASAIMQTNFEKLKKEGLISKNKSSNSILVPSSHFRKGVSGSWENELPLNIVKDIKTRFGHVMKEVGYDF